MLFSLLIPLLVGIWLDKKWDTEPFMILVGSFVGILAATVGVARMVLRTFPRTLDTDSDQVADTSAEEEPE
jgi:F0F1-type ATP synthase assembly protein I